MALRYGLGGQPAEAGEPQPRSLAPRDDPEQFGLVTDVAQKDSLAVLVPNCLWLEAPGQPPRSIRPAIRNSQVSVVASLMAVMHGV